MSDPSTRFLKTLDALEEQLDRGFFLSFINKIIVDEKRIYTIINELRSMATESFAHRPAGREEELFARPAPKPAPAPQYSSGSDAKAEEIIANAMREAESIKAGADDYARQVLSELENKLNNALRAVGEGKRVLNDRLGGGY